MNQSQATFSIDCRLYGILDLGYVTPDRVEQACRQMLEGGVQTVQLRAKTVEPGLTRDLALRLLPVTRSFGVPLVINDDPELAGGIGAEAFHVGQDDLSLAEARRLAGPGLFGGKSTHSLDQAVAAELEGADYIGFGPLFGTPTKPDYTPIGLDDIAEVHRRVKLPIFCIGGIKLENLDEVLAAGARRVVVVSGILQADDITGYCRALREKLEATSP